MPKYKKCANAVELANKLAVLIFGIDVMIRSGLSTGTGDKMGKYRALDESKLEEIEGIIRMYRGKGDVWKEYEIREKIGSKCQRLRINHKKKSVL